MSEQLTMAAVSRPNTIASLTAQLRTLGVTEGDTLMVHSAMSSLGWVCGGEQAVIEALIAAVGAGGTLCMPAHTGALSDPAAWQHPPVPKEWVDEIRETMPAFDPDKSPTRGIGKVAECFRKWPDVKRSNHPHTSLCAYGRLADDITSSHPLTPQLGMTSPYGALYRLGAKVLLVGVGYDHCTILHLSETLMEHPPLEHTGAPVLVDGQREWVWYDDVETDSDRFPKLGQDYELAGGAVSLGKVGNAECRLLPAQELVDYGTRWLNDYAGHS